MKRLVCKILTAHIYNAIVNDMGYWFDEIQNNEEETYNEIYNTLMYGTKEEKKNILEFV